MVINKNSKQASTSPIDADQKSQIICIPNSRYSLTALSNGILFIGDLATRCIKNSWGEYIYSVDDEIETTTTAMEKADSGSGMRAAHREEEFKLESVSGYVRMLRGAGMTDGAWPSRLHDSGFIILSGLARINPGKTDTMID